MTSLTHRTLGSSKRQRESGVVLLSTLLLLIIIFGICGSLVMFSIADARDVTESTDRLMAFFLAESGLEAAKWEIAQFQDPDLNGIGNKDVFTGNGAYQVAARDLGKGRFELTSTGRSGQTDIRLQAVVGRIGTSRFPGGAISIVGKIGNSAFNFQKDSGLVVSGQDSPAITSSDRSLFDTIVRELSDAIAGETLSAESISGSGSTDVDVDGNPVELPVVYNPNYREELGNLEDLYRELVQRVGEASAKATVLRTLRGADFGSPDSPATVFLPGLYTVTGETITGHGTLIVTDRFYLGNGSRLDWDGDVFIVGDRTDAELEVNNASVNIRGNLVVLGKGDVGSRLTIHSGSDVAVEGSAFLGTPRDVGMGAKAGFQVDAGGSLGVNGLLTVVGPEILVDVKAEKGDSFNVSGMMQMAVPESNVRPTSLEVDIKGDFEIHRDLEAIRKGVEALQSFSPKYRVTLIGNLVTSEDMRVYTWRRLAES